MGRLFLYLMIFWFAHLTGGYFCLRFLVAWTGSFLSQFLHSGSLVILRYNVFMLLFWGVGLLTGGGMGVLFSGFLTGFLGRSP